MVMTAAYIYEEQMTTKGLTLYITRVGSNAGMSVVALPYKFFTKWVIMQE
jgi:hypothetical protein